MAMAALSSDLITSRSCFSRVFVTVDLLPIHLSNLAHETSLQLVVYGLGADTDSLSDQAIREDLAMESFNLATFKRS